MKLGRFALKVKQTLLPKLTVLAAMTALAFVVACSQATTTAPDLGATVDAAVAATVEAQDAAPPSEPTQSNLGQANQTQVLKAAPIPTSMPTVMPVPTPTPTPTSAPTSTSIATPAPDAHAYTHADHHPYAGTGDSYPRPIANALSRGSGYV